MRTIEIDAVPNQQFSVTIDGNRWSITLKQAVNAMVADVTLNEVPILYAQRLVSGTPMIPYRYLQGDGNFLILTENGELPNWERFGIDQTLIYATAAEIAAAQVAS